MSNNNLKFHQLHHLYRGQHHSLYSIVHRWIKELEVESGTIKEIEENMERNYEYKYKKLEIIFLIIRE